MASFDRSTQWYYGADGQIYPAENNGDGAEFPMAPIGEDGREVRIVDDPALIKARKIELLGYDMDDRQVNQNGSREVQIKNPMTGQFETGVITADGLEMPLSLAQAQGKQIIQYMSDPVAEGGGLLGQAKEGFIDSGAYMPFLAAATPWMAGQVGALTGLNPMWSNAIVGGGKSLLTGGDPLLGAAMSVGSSMLADALPGGVDVSTTDGGGATDVAGYNVTSDGGGLMNGDASLSGLGGGGLGFRLNPTGDLPGMGGAQGLVAPGGTYWGGDFLPGAIGAAGAGGSFLGGNGGSTTLSNAGITGGSGGDSGGVGTTLLGIAKTLLGGGSDGSDSTLAALLKAALPAGIGAWAASNQADAYRDLATADREAQAGRYADIVARDDSRYRDSVERYNAETAKRDAALAEFKGYGAPYRQRLSDLYADPTSFLTSPDVQAPVQQGTDAMARALSARVGNPVGSPGALQEIQNYSTNALYTKLGEEKNRLGTLGGIASFNQSGAGVPGLTTTLPTGSSSGSGVGTGGTSAFDAKATDADAGVWNALGSGVANYMNPPSSLDSILKQLRASGFNVGLK